MPYLVERYYSAKAELYTPDWSKYRFGVLRYESTPNKAIKGYIQYIRHDDLPAPDEGDIYEVYEVADKPERIRVKSRRIQYAFEPAPEE